MDKERRVRVEGKERSRERWKEGRKQDRAVFTVSRPGIRCAGVCMDCSASALVSRIEAYTAKKISHDKQKTLPVR